MRLLATGIFVLLLASALGVGVSAQRTVIPPDLDTVEVVGCLSAVPDGSWILTNATAPVVQRTTYTDEAAIKAAREKALGKQRFRLLNTKVFSPEAHKGHKMAIRGLLLKDAKVPTVTITSLQMLDPGCTQ